MKTSCLAALLCISSLVLAQAPAAPKPALPTISDADRANLLMLVNQRHEMQEKMYAVEIDVLQRQMKASNDLQSLQAQHSAIQKQIDSKVDALPFDHENFTFNAETALFTGKTKPAPPNPPAPSQSLFMPTKPGTH